MSKHSEDPIKGVKVQKRKVASIASTSSLTSTHQQLMNQATKMKRTKINEMKNRNKIFQTNKLQPFVDCCCATTIGSLVCGPLQTKHCSRE